jgi:hypothetical protein
MAKSFAGGTQVQERATEHHKHVESMWSALERLLVAVEGRSMQAPASGLRRTLLRNCLKRGSSNAPRAALAGVPGPKRAEWYPFGALQGYVSGISGAFQTVSWRTSEKTPSRHSAE